jgi:pSer/pThr/pTyr-binding forkhead associated (FHA) protein
LLYVTGSGASIRDLNSRNSTVVNSQRLRKGEQTLRDGDELYFFVSTFRVEIHSADRPDEDDAVVVRGEGVGETIDFPDERTKVVLDIAGYE